MIAACVGLLLVGGLLVTAAPAQADEAFTPRFTANQPGLDLRESGISFLYATHNLSTAYHLADELIVLHEGETVQRGPARDVIDAPRHPYTRELVESVPTLEPR